MTLECDAVNVIYIMYIYRVIVFFTHAPQDRAFTVCIDSRSFTAVRKAGNQLEDYLGRYQPMRIGHIALLKEVRRLAGRNRLESHKKEVPKVIRL